jgi:hypothetical protein
MAASGVLSLAEPLAYGMVACDVLAAGIILVLVYIPQTKVGVVMVLFRLLTGLALTRLATEITLLARGALILVIIMVVFLGVVVIVPMTMPIALIQELLLFVVTALFRLLMTQGLMSSAMELT